jgi:coproporphyrinogen III oxidase-like Fe-S oxidoreductase
MANDLEITLEANPASAEAARFADYKRRGREPRCRWGCRP